MERLEDRDELVEAGELGVASVAQVEGDAVLHPAPDEVRPRELDGGLVEVVAVDGDLRVGAGDRDARPPGAAGDVGDSGGRVGEEPLVDVGDGRQPLGAEQVGEERPVRVSLRVAPELAVGLPGDAAAGAERFLDGRQHARERYAEARHGRHVRERLPVDQHLGVAGRQPVAPLVRRGAGVVHLEDARDGLLLEPFPRIALVAARRGGELAGGRSPVLPQGAVEAEAVAQVHGHDLVGPERSAEEALGERVPCGRVGVRGHRSQRWSSGGFWTLCSSAYSCASWFTTSMPSP